MPVAAQAMNGSSMTTPMMRWSFLTMLTNSADVDGGAQDR